MARPKGSKNKAADVPTEFNYEDSDALYQQVMSSGAVAPVRDEIDLAVGGFDTPPAVNVPLTSIQSPLTINLTSATPIVDPVSHQIFLVEGKVRLDQDGAAPVFSDQRRIVNATNVDEALAKFMRYFAGMSNPVQRYTVVQAAASETIL